MLTNLKGRIRNTPLPRAHALLPMFEAVVNSIDSIEEKFSENISDGKITVRVSRAQVETPLPPEGQPQKTQETIPDITGFSIYDNGIGFNDKNFSSFETLDSDYKEQKGCRGVGRLLWLKAFNNVNIISNYINIDNEAHTRSFLFSDSGVSNVRVSKSSTSDGTTVTLNAFKKEYRTNAPKSGVRIAEALLEHCLWYFLRDGGCPHIQVIDQGITYELSRVYENYILDGLHNESVNIKNSKFDLIYAKVRNSKFSSHEIHYSAARRLVHKENITNKISGLYKRIQDEKGNFVLACFVSSDFLDSHVRAERISFDIPNHIEGMLEETEISLEDIYSTILQRIENFLGTDLSKNIENGKKRINEFVAQKAPKYRPILERIYTAPNISIDPDVSDRELDLALYKAFSKVEANLIEAGHEILSPKSTESIDDYKKRVQDYLALASDIKKSDLANYVSHRRVIIDFFEYAVAQLASGVYEKEDLIHNLIMPMKTDSNHIKSDDANLWLIDEKLSFHNYLASNLTLNAMPITDCSKTLKPDILSLNVYDNPILVNDGSQLPLASITVVEIKRPMRDDYAEGIDKNPIEQALNYIDEVRDGNVKTASGRPIPKSDMVPAFCYILADLTKTMITRCKNANLKHTSDQLGYFGYNDARNAYIEVISYNKLINDAKERNRAFFDKLGLPTT